MTHQEGESRIKGLQKQFLTWVETHEYLKQLTPDLLNKIRRNAFSFTFEAFRLGRVGVSSNKDSAIWNKFFGWASVVGLPQNVELELQMKCFEVSLEAFRVGALVTGAENAIQCE